MVNINIIAAVAENGAIGLNGKLLYWLPADLRRFKALTTGHTIIMGRKTFESLPKGALPNRRNIVLSRSKKNFPGAERFSSLTEAIAACNLPRRGLGRLRTSISLAVQASMPKPCLLPIAYA